MLSGGDPQALGLPHSPPSGTSAHLQGLVDALGPGFVCLLGWKLCLLKLQELAPQDLWGQGMSAASLGPVEGM